MMTRAEWDKLTDDEKWEYVQEIESRLSDEDEGGFDYKFVVHEIDAASRQAEIKRQVAREETRLFWERHEREHPRDENGEWK